MSDAGWPPAPSGPVTSSTQPIEAFRVALGLGHHVAELIGSRDRVDALSAGVRQAYQAPGTAGVEARLADAVDEFVAAMHMAVPLLVRDLETLSDRCSEALRSCQDDDHACAAAFDSLAGTLAHDRGYTGGHPPAKAPG